MVDFSNNVTVTCYIVVDENGEVGVDFYALSPEVPDLEPLVDDVTSLIVEKGAVGFLRAVADQLEAQGARWYTVP